MVRRLGSAQRERLIDAALACALAAVSVSSVFVGDPAGAERLFPPPSAALVALVLLGSLPLVLRRQWPLIVHLVMVVSVAAIDVLGWYPGVVGACLMFSLYTVAERCPLRGALIGLAAQAAMVFGLALIGSPYYSGVAGLLAAALYLAPWVVGRMVQHNRHAREIAVQQALAAERERAVAEARAVIAERLRIARELHDIVAHTLSIIAVQSAAARHRLGEKAGPATDPLQVIEQASRRALNDLRRMLGMLRTDDEPASAARAPVSDWGELEAVVAAHRSTHGPVELIADDSLISQPESVRLTVVRLVQESLTNVGKHAPGAAATVIVRCDDAAICVEVDNGASLRPVSDGLPGFGLRGLRERVALFGGTLSTVAKPDGGFRVEARLDAGRVG